MLSAGPILARSIFDGNEEQAMIPAEAFAAAHRLEKKNRQQKALGKVAPPRTIGGVTAAIVATKFEIPLEPRLVGGRILHTAPPGTAAKGARTKWVHFTMTARHKPVECTKDTGNCVGFSEIAAPVGARNSCRLSQERLEPRRGRRDARHFGFAQCRLPAAGTAAQRN
jgi:hypothetical protein